jgi:hypothetical protein
MAETQHSAGTAHDSQTEREMTINLRPYGWRRWEFEGTRAQLEAEGVIPTGTEWPATGARWVEWKGGPLKFHLRRSRPPGLKGPMRLWVNGDWWCLHCDLIKEPDMRQQRLIDAQQETDRAAYEASPAGRRAFEAHLRRYWTAQEDKRFQSFKVLIPGLVPPPRGRRPKASPPSA